MFRKIQIYDQLERIIPLPTSSSDINRSLGFREKELDPETHRDDSVFEFLTSDLTSPSIKDDKDNYVIKRSYRIMTYIAEDINASEEMINSHSKLAKEKDNDDLYDGRFMKPSRAGLLAKKIFSAYRHLVKLHSSTDTKMDEVRKPHIPHLNKVLSTLLGAFPTQVVGASCVGGKDGIEQSLKPMLELHTFVESRHSPLSAMAEIIAIGCTGRKKGNMSMQQQQQQAMMGNPVNLDEILISNGHRRKFVRGFTQWGGFTHLTNLITKDISYAYDVGDVLLSTVEFISFPQIQPPGLSPGNQNGVKVKEEESVGEESLLAMLASEETFQGLLECCITNGEGSHDEDIDAVSSFIMQLFELATGKARKKMNPPAVDITEDNGSVECKMAKEESKPHQAGIDDNKLMKSGVTDKMHLAMNAKMKQLVRAIDLQLPVPKENGDSKDVDCASTCVKHPGHQVEKPFTSNRLQFLTLFADMVSYESHYGLDMTEGSRNLGKKALETIMELPLPPSSEADVDTKDDDELIIYNPWPGIVDLLFEYPENTLYQYQFYRMLHSLCATNHEPTLKLVVQKNKFLSRAIKVCKVKTSPASTRGVLLRCLNALRLHSLSLPSTSFLRHYLHSHDGWKAFEDELKRMTLEQQQVGGGIAVPKVVEGESATVVTLQSDINIDLGSSFATSLGFPPSIQPYIESEESTIATQANTASSASPTKKKKKKKKGKKKH